MVGAHFISTYSGMSYTEFVKARIWDPLGMLSTTFNASQAIQVGLLTQSWTSSGRRIPFWFSDEAIALLAGPAGIISNVPDLVSTQGLL
jgi:CubicO group peptidase (beta-lactamase class C family)